MNPTNKASRNDRNRKMAAGVKKHFATAATIPIDGVPTPPADVEKALQAPIDLADATAAAETAFHQAVAAEKAATRQANALFLGLKTYLLSVFANAPDTLGDFGLAQTQKRVPTAATKAEAAQKRAATRAMRHTMGKRQKATLKAPAASTAAAAPAEPSAAPAATPSPAPAAPPTTPKS